MMLFTSHCIGPQKLLLEQQPLASNPVCRSRASVRARPPSISAALVVSHLPRTFTLPRSCFVASFTLYGATKTVAWGTRCANPEGIVLSRRGATEDGATLPSCDYGRSARKNFMWFEAVPAPMNWNELVMVKPAIEPQLLGAVRFVPVTIT